MTWQPGLQTILITYCPRRKDNQKMKFGQLIECNMRKKFEKSYIRCGGETSLRPFPGN